MTRTDGTVAEELKLTSSELAQIKLLSRLIKEAKRTKTIEEFIVKLEKLHDDATNN